MARTGKVTVVGAGFYGSTTAQRLAEYDIFTEVVLTDIVEGKLEGLEYGISGVYLGVNAELGDQGVNRVVNRVVETELTDDELAALKQAAEAVRAKQADVESL